MFLSGLIIYTVFLSLIWFILNINVELRYSYLSDSIGFAVAAFNAW